MKRTKIKNDVRDRKVCGKTYWQVVEACERATAERNRAWKHQGAAARAWHAWDDQHGEALRAQEQAIRDRERAARDKREVAEYHESVRKTKHLADADDKARKQWERRKRRQRQGKVKA